MKISLSSENPIARIRRNALDKRRSMSPGQRARESKKIASQFLQSGPFFRSTRIGCYISMVDEVDTHEIILRAWSANKRIFVPVINSNGSMQFRELRDSSRLERNRYGIWEPVNGDFIDAKGLDVVVTPLAAFDDNNQRIGMGGGFYDRTFSFLKSRTNWQYPMLIGVAFACQHVRKFKANPWDIKLCKILTES